MRLTSNAGLRKRNGDGGKAMGKTVLLALALALTVVLLIHFHNNNDSSSSLSQQQQQQQQHNMDVYLSSLSSTGRGGESLNNNNLRQQQQQQTTAVATTAAADWDRSNPLGIPPGEALALPSIRVEQDAAAGDGVEKKLQRGIYGGAGDKKHLGGFTEIDLHGVSPAVWKYMLTELGVHSVLDVGCGRGISTAWFYAHGCRVKCAEGSHDAVIKTMLPPDSNLITEHDFSRGPWWPADTYDAAWAVEFLEHVGVPYQFNYMAAFRKCALLFVTSSRWGGWHHVEVHQDYWWIRKYEAVGFRYDKELTDKVRNIALREQRSNETAPTGESYNAQHVWLSMKVFVNPVVAALPQHAHLFPEHGCFEGKHKDGAINHRICGTGKLGHLETPLPEEHFPLKLTPEQDKAWADLVRRNLQVPKEK